MTNDYPNVNPGDSVFVIPESDAAEARRRQLCEECRAQQAPRLRTRFGPARNSEVGVSPIEEAYRRGYREAAWTMIDAVAGVLPVVRISSLSLWLGDLEDLWLAAPPGAEPPPPPILECRIDRGAAQ